VRAVSNASPLIILARVGYLAGLRQLFRSVHIPEEVYNEVVIAGAGLPGASAVSKADWIEVSTVSDQAALTAMVSKTGLGSGEAAAVQLAKELGAEIVLMDERRGRRFVQGLGLAVVGSVGILEELWRRGAVADLRTTYSELLRQNVRIDARTLEYSLRQFKLPPL